MAPQTGLDSHRDLCASVIRGHNCPPDSCSVPLLLLVRQVELEPVTTMQDGIAQKKQSIGLFLLRQLTARAALRAQTAFATAMSQGQTCRNVNQNEPPKGDSFWL